MNNGGQSEPTDGPKSVAMVTSPQLLDVVWCSAGVVVVADVVLLVAVAYSIVLSEALCCMM